LNAPNKSKGIIASNVHANIVIIVCSTAFVVASVKAVAAFVVPHNPSTHTAAINSKMIRDKTSAIVYPNRFLNQKIPRGFFDSRNYKRPATNDE